ncbi:MAG TPA: hypothetical protein VFB14_24095 [Bryobacteraceae bacterium]|jgi:hypothetical protein|nr:hypothetical protein [Bryobacteraceae bacterium]
MAKEPFPPKKPLTPSEQWRNICDALAEDALHDTTPLTKEEQERAARMKERLLKVIDEHQEGHAARLDAKQADPKGRSKT